MIGKDGGARLRLRAAVSCAAPVAVAAALLATPAVSLAGGAGIGGTVIEASGGAPIQGIEACAWKLASTLEEEGGAGEPGCVQTNAAGEYEIDGLNAGSYAVFFSLPLVTTLNFVGQLYDDRTVGQEPTPVDVTEGSITSHVDAALEPGAELEGTVVSAGTGGGLEGVLVCAIDVSEEEFVACTKSSAGGAFTLAGVPAGTFAIYFAYFGHEENGLGYLGGGHSLAEATPLTIAAREVRSGLTEALTLKTLPTREPGPGGGEPRPGELSGGAAPRRPGAGGTAVRGLALVAPQIVVGPLGEARISVRCTGSAICRGRIVLRERQITRDRSRRVVLGATRYAVKPGAIRTVDVRLDSLGRRELRARHGRLPFHAAVVQTAPAPAGISVVDVVLLAARHHVPHR